VANPHSTQLGSATALGTTDSLLYTVPASKRTIVKSLQAQNNGSSAVWIEWSFFQGSTLLCQIIRPLAAATAAGGSDNFQPWIVLNAGGVIKAHMSAGTGQVILSGAELAA
jgi:hypothetical protein